MKVTLARALKYKNRVVERMRKLEGDIAAHNSVLEGAERDLDPKAALDERIALQNHLIQLKLKLDAANAPIKDAIATSQELKGWIAFLQRINTSHGKVDARRTMYGEQGEINYQAAIRKVDVDKMVSAAQQEIDALQERMDQFNNITTIEVEILSL